MKATVSQVRKHYKDQGCAVRISRNGRVQFRLPALGARWSEGCYVCQYRIIDGHVVLS